MAAAQASVTLCEDLGRLFLLDMVLGNAGEELPSLKKWPETPLIHLDYGFPSILWNETLASHLQQDVLPTV